MSEVKKLIQSLARDVDDAGDSRKFPPVADPDSKSREQQEDLLEAARRNRYESDTDDRKWLAQWSATVVSMWLLATLMILCCNSERFHLSDTVLNVLLGTTTLNVLGLSFIVLKGLFPSSSRD